MTHSVRELLTIKISEPIAVIEPFPLRCSNTDEKRMSRSTLNPRHNNRLWAKSFRVREGANKIHPNSWMTQTKITQNSPIL